MNKVVLMLFVGVVFVAASVNAERLTLPGAKKATFRVMRHYKKALKMKNGVRYFSYPIDKVVGMKTFYIRCFEILKKDIGYKDLKCGIDDDYNVRLEASDYQTFRAWFKTVGQKTGNVHPPEWKGLKDQYQVNAVYRECGAPFKINFHIPVTKPRGNRNGNGNKANGNKRQGQNKNGNGNGNGNGKHWGYGNGNGNGNGNDNNWGYGNGNKNQGQGNVKDSWTYLHQMLQQMLLTRAREQ